ncbi:PorP/SprF family type IX secretion system membrane protein [Flavobacterium sp. LB2P84]|jgi:type IX secretion system PorP/SprF family membrane protein|uniref:PorP/SprF family type IX secretion system membrane protein n=1 Tax=Flavobacterium yafengii TaxID=3041253 RepID=A0AAW6TNP4_9FLAO|nr:PorP/SprF family type IX secretion system membrane protein [Flavobacterium yafengii]MDI5897219.1 PorP/SprF family type IX secretion system membrane protein [Flavobacterium yafengii]MDI5949743.1 PorP/SprF family type IX secretion system membrane protein [Flavobacterium yafengii]MDI6032943.1 PorP/SprF family type IX secretion system membrane protein [Flavobacterium yafengii]MDI6046065.1 PorP/SprF family type IX secretion system membrane protein [Flavobacterium yafengii]
MKIKIAALILLLGFSLTVKAQDPIFTQYFMVPETLNPGFTGFLETTKAGILHRTQWPDLNFRVDTDYGFINTWLENVNSGVGISVLNHREKFTDYNFTQVNLNYAYRVQLNDEWFFRPAIEVGFGNKSFGFQNIILEDQINIGLGTINSSSVDPLLLNEKVSFFDFSAGMLFNNENAWFGLSLKHLNKPNISFSTIGNVPLEMFFSANAGYEFKLGDYIDITVLPYETRLLLTSNYMTQGEYSRFDLGTGLVFEKFFFGVSGATNPGKKTDKSHFLTSINAFGGLQYEHFKFGYSYDFNTSKIGKTGGIFELSVIYQFDLEVKCFGCPNYY